MRIAIISKSFKTGGAAIAASRLLDALQKHSADVVGITPRRFEFLRFVIETFMFAFYARSRKVLFSFSLGFIGERIKLQADIVHLHWINGSFISLRRIRKLLDSHKVVWTLHDMWPVTGGCHCPVDCFKYRNGCGNCQYLHRPNQHDLSSRLWNKKKKVFTNKEITLIASSLWIGDQVKDSAIFKRANIHVIPNCVDHKIFTPLSIEKRKAIIFGAYNVLHTVKGLNYLYEAIKYLDPDTEIILFGKNTDKVYFPLKTHRYPLINNPRQLACLYNTSQVAVVPSIYDNLPSVVMEAMACGTPVVAFRVGGITEMVDHKINGYLAKPFDAKDLATGIKYAMFNKILGINAREKVLKNYTPDIIAEKHMEIYNGL